MNTEDLHKGLKRMSIFIVLCFIGPVVLHQAFKNEGHPYFWPVCIIGGIICIASIFYGFWGIKTLLNGLLGNRKN
jgi:hypothetical protein